MIGTIERSLGTTPSPLPLCSLSPNIMKKTTLLALWSVTSLTISAHAQSAVLFADNFDRANADTPDADTTGITNNTGTTLGVGTTYSVPFGGTRTNIGGIDNPNGLDLAEGPGTSNVFINHNFTNADITTAGGFSVSMDVTNIGGGSAGQGVSFAVGMSTARAGTAGDAMNGSTPVADDDDTNKMQDGISSSVNDETDVSIADFWLMLRGDGSLVWGGLGNSVTFNNAIPLQDDSGLMGKVAVGETIGTISATFLFADFNAGTVVNYEVFLNGISQGTGTFPWSESDQNHIGLDARGSIASVDNLSISTVSIPLIPTVSIARSVDDFSVTFEGVLQESPDLATGNWTTLDPQPVSPYQVTIPPGVKRFFRATN